MIFKVFLFLSFVFAHGFLIGPTDCNGNLLGKIRNYKAISTNIDSLRSPSSSRCRGAPSETPTSLKIGSKICVLMAISNAARHVGPCSLEFQSSSGNVIKIGEHPQCIADSTITGASVPGLTDSSMSTHSLEFNVENPELITNGYLRWNWIGQHLTPYENFENCIDITTVAQKSPVITPLSTKPLPVVPFRGTTIEEDEEWC